MNSDALRHALRIKFETASPEPTEAQLASIVRDIDAIGRTRMPTEVDWGQATRRYCPTTGTMLYRGLDTSDLNALLAQFKAQVPQRP